MTGLTPDQILMGATLNAMDQAAPDTKVPDECTLNGEKTPDCAGCMAKGRHACQRGIQILRQRGD